MTGLGLRPSYDAIIFDWDGCIAKTLSCWITEFRRAYNERGLFPTNLDLSSRFGQWDKAVELGIPTEEVPEFNARVRAVAELALRTVDLYPGARDVLQKLKMERSASRLGGIALWTGSYTEAIQAPLEHHGLVEVFDAIVTKSDPLQAKPDPEGIFVALKRLGFDTTTQIPRAVVVGDTDKDIVAAQNAGIDSIWVNHPENEEVYGTDQIAHFRSLGPTYEITSFSALKPLLLPRP